MNKKLAPLRAKNDVTHAIQLKLHERKLAVTSYGRNKSHDDEIKNIAGRIPEATRTTKTSQKAEAITFCIKPLTHYLRGSDLKIGEI